MVKCAYYMPGVIFTLGKDEWNKISPFYLKLIKHNNKVIFYNKKIILPLVHSLH